MTYFWVSLSVTWIFRSSLTGWNDPGKVALHVGAGNPNCQSKLWSGGCCAMPCSVHHHLMFVPHWRGKAQNLAYAFDRCFQDWWIKRGCKEEQLKNFPTGHFPGGFSVFSFFCFHKNPADSKSVFCSCLLPEILHWKQLPSEGKYCLFLQKYIYANTDWYICNLTTNEVKYKLSGLQHRSYQVTQFSDIYFTALGVKSTCSWSVCPIDLESVAS